MSVDSLLEQAERHFAEGNMGSAWNALKEAEAIEPLNPSVLTNLGVIAFFEKRFVEAVLRFSSALYIDPKNKDALLNLYDLLKETGGMPLLRPMLTKMIESFGDDAELVQILEEIENPAERETTNIAQSETDEPEGALEQNSESEEAPEDVALEAAHSLQEQTAPMAQSVDETPLQADEKEVDSPEAMPSAKEAKFAQSTSEEEASKRQESAKMNLTARELLERALNPQQRQLTPALRPFPYPYQAAFTLANDIDLTSFEAFKAIFGFLCSTKPTHFGDGLGLPLSSSFFLYPSGAKDEFSYFADLEGKDGEHRETLERLIQQGYLDNIHGFGDFNEKTNPFKRRYAERAYEILEKRGLKIPIWSSHGDEGNTQRIDTSGELLYAKGDDKTNEAYHLDLSLAYGIRYFRSQYGGGKAEMIVQEILHPLKFGTHLFLASANEGLKRYLPVEVPEGTTQINLKGNELITQATMKDGNSIFNFRRTKAGYLRPTVDKLAYQLTPDNLSELVQTEGVMALYQRLGCKEGKKGKSVTTKFPFLPKGAVEAFRRVKRLYDEGYLWVAPLAKILDYYYMSRRISWEHETQGDKDIIRLTGLKHPQGEPIFELSETLLEGLTFTAPKPENTIIEFQGKALKTVVNEADNNGYASLSIPIETMEGFDVD